MASPRGLEVTQQAQVHAVLHSFQIFDSRHAQVEIPAYWVVIGAHSPLLPVGGRGSVVPVHCPGIAQVEEGLRGRLPHHDDVFIYWPDLLWVWVRSPVEELLSLSPEFIEARDGGSLNAPLADSMAALQLGSSNGLRWALTDACCSIAFCTVCLAVTAAATAEAASL